MLGLLYGLGGCLSWGLIIVGILSCFFGFSIFKWSLRISGFFVGAGVGLLLALAIGSNDSTLPVIMVLVFGVLGAILAVPLHFLFTFLQGALIGAILIEVLFLILQHGDAPTLLIILGAISAGVLAVVFEVSYIIISTSITGALAIVFGANIIMRGELSTFLSLLAIVGLSAAGIYFQFKRLPPKALLQAASTRQPWICPNCGAANDFGRATCIRCGQAFASAAPYPGPIQAGAPGVPLAAAQTVVCPNCKSINQAGYKFCKQCGYSLVVLKPQPGAFASTTPTALAVECPKCGVENPPAAFFCGACGTSLQKSSPQAEG